MDAACPFCSFRLFSPATGQKRMSEIKSDTIATVSKVLMDITIGITDDQRAVRVQWYHMPSFHVPKG
jgi:hypothetical protein